MKKTIREFIELAKRSEVVIIVFMNGDKPLFDLFVNASDVCTELQILWGQDDVDFDFFISDEGNLCLKASLDHFTE